MDTLLPKSTRHPGFLLAVLTLLQATSLANTVFDVTAPPFSAVPDSGNDATEAFQQAIAAAKAVAGPVTLQVPAGRYDFFSTHATRRICYCSNATESSSDGTRTIAIDLTDINDLTISGPGASLVMRGKMTLLVAERCENLTLSGLEFDFDRPTFSEITAVEKQGAYWIGEVHQDSDYTITGGNRVRWFGEDWQDYHNMVQHFDHVNGKVWRGGDPTSGASAVTDLGNRRLRFDGGSLGNVVEGRTYQFRNTYRDEVGMWFNRCRNVVMEDVAVRAMHGFGIDSQFTEDVTFSRLTVAPSPDGGRTNASAADILHFSNCKGTIRILDSTLSAAHDDALNVHGTHLRIVGQPARDQLRLRFMHHQSWGFQAFVPGDEIELVNKDTLLAYETATVTAVTMSSDPKEQTITIDKELRVAALNSDAVENVTWTPAVELINCDIRSIPTRGILLSTRRPILIQGNRFFRTSMHGILIEDDAQGWYESGPVHDLTVRGNSFFECAESVIQINPHYNAYAGPVHRDIRVENNVFTLTGNGAAYAKAVDGLTFSDNRFRMRNGSTPPASSLVSTNNATGLGFSGNVVESASAPAFAIGNGDFEQADPGPGAEPADVAAWFSATGNGSRTVNSGSRLLELDPGAAVYQDLGPYDPAQGSYLRVSLDLVEATPAASPLQVSLLRWDGRFEAADGTDAGALEALLSQDFATPETGLRTSLDLSGLAAGTRLWLRLAAPVGTVRVDNLELAQNPPPETSSFEGWMEFMGVFGDDALPDADPDADQIPNLVEYLLAGFDPLIADPNPLKATLVQPARHPAFCYFPRSAPDGQLDIEYQVDRLNDGAWEPVVDGVDGLSLRDDADGSRWIDVAPPLPGSMFLRLNAQMVVVSIPLAVTNGGFGISNQNATIVDGGGWFESSSSAWVEGSWANPGAYPATFPAGSGMAALFDGAAANAYLYQSLGTVDAPAIAAGTLQITADFAEKSDDFTVDGVFDVYAGDFPEVGFGVDIASAGLTKLFSRTMTAADQGLSSASGDQSRANDVLVGEVDISGLTPGDELWLRIGRPSSGGGDFIVDDVAVAVALF